MEKFIGVIIFALVLCGYALGYMSGYTDHRDRTQAYECEYVGE
jgi:hypothetical protein